jgi:membrane protease YdiL (CAAX protease family)
MLDSQNDNPPVSATARPPRTWDFMETTFVALIAYAVFGLTAGLSLGVLLVIQGGVEKLSSAQFEALAIHWNWYGAALIISCPPTIAVLWIAIRMAGREFAEYLALNWPSLDELMRAFAVAAIILAVQIPLWYSEPSAHPFFAVGGAGGLLVLLIGGCIAGPIMEEFVFRGFMFRGWSESFLGPIGAIVLTSALFGMYHTQYDWLGRLWIFVFGLALCTFRWRSNSTWLTVVVHSAVNIVLFFTLGPYV